MRFELQPTLRGERLELRPLRAEDWEAVFAVAADPLIWDQHPAWDRYQEPVFRKFFQAALDCGGGFAVRDLKTGRIIGSTRFDNLDEAAGEIEIGWTFLARSHWGGPYNREMKHLMLAHAFRFVDRVVFTIGPENFRSRRAVEKLGAILTGEITDGDQKRVRYELSRTEFVASTTV